MPKRLRNILIIVLIILILIGMGFALYFSQRIEMNPDGTVGNTAGNLNNDGLFCEYDGKVYFSNAADGGSLYSMDPDETNVKILKTLKVDNLLAGGRYLYYYQSGAARSTNDSGFSQLKGVKSFDRYDLKRNKSISLTRDEVDVAQLVNNFIYILTYNNDGILFYKMKIDKSEKTELANYVINPACAEDGVLYFNGTQNDHYLYSLNSETDVMNEVWGGNIWYPVKDGNYIYYLDVANNYRLCRYSLSANVIQVLTEDRVDCFNVGNGYIYYQKNSETEPQLKGMNLDGSGVFVVAEGNYTKINMTSRYVYFQAFGVDDITYHSTLGSSSYSQFLVYEEN